MRTGGHPVTGALQGAPSMGGKAFEGLLQAACRAGASAVAVLPAGDIVSKDALAEMCRKPRCENYGLVLID